MKTIILILLFITQIQAQNLLLFDEDSWTPAEISTSFWYAGDDALQDFAVSGKKWVGRSGNGEIAYTTASSNVPSTGTLDGHTTLIFDGTADFFKDTIALSQPVTVYMVMKQITWTSDDMVFSGGGTGGGDVGLCRQRGTTPELNIYSGTGWAADNTDLTVNTWAILRVVFNGASSSIRVNNETATTGNAGTGNLIRFTIGAYCATNEGLDYFSNIEVAEIIGFAGGIVSADNDTNIMAYCKSKYPSLP